MNDFKKPRIVRIAKRLEKQSLCNNCFGRQLAKVSTGMTNQERGVLMRKLLKTKEPESCSVCSSLFKNLGLLARKAEKALLDIEFSTFLVGSKMSRELLKREEALWEACGIEQCEPLKSELNREVGKLLQKSLKKKASDYPDIMVILNLQSGKVELDIRSLFIFGAYKKLVRGIPQTKWDTYKTTVEDIIAKPFMNVSKATAHSMHAAGREDIDARCLDWRPFVFELFSPKKRILHLKKLEKEVNRSKKIQVKYLRPSTKKEVVAVKSIKPDKSYQALIKLEEKITPQSLRSLKKLIGTINQKTPTRVLHRRADILRKRNVKTISAKRLTSKTALLKIRGEAGLYIKELVSGDRGRTSPSVADMLGPAVVKKLDVIKIHLKEKLW